MLRIADFRNKALHGFCRTATALTLVMLIACSAENASDFHAEGKKLVDEGNVAGAVVFFVNALDKDPTNFDIRLELALAYMKLGKLPLAEAEFQKCLRQKPDDPGLHLAIGKYSVLARKPDDALRHLAMAEKGLNPTAESRELTALAYSMLDRLQDAEKTLNEALEIAPGAQSASLALVRVYLAQHRPKEALTLVDKLIADDPSFVDALRLRGNMALQTDDLDKAVSCCRRVLQLNPGDEASRYLLGMTLLRQNNIAEAEKARDALRAGGRETVHAAMLDGLIAYQKGDLKAAANFFQKSVELSPSVEGYYRLGLTQAKLGERETALSSLQRVLDFSPRHGSALQLRAQVLLEQQRAEDALREVEKLVGYYPDNASGHYLHGLILRAKDDAEGSRAALQRALTLNPAMSEASAALSSILIAEKRFDEAENELTKSLEANTANISSWMALFNYYLGRGDISKAEQILAKGLNEMPDNATLLTVRASMALDRRQEAEGLLALSKVREIAPDFVPALNLEVRYYTLSGQPEKALEACDEYLSRHPGAVEQLIASAVLLDALNRSDEATQRLEKVHALGERRAFYLLVQRDLDSRRVKEAEKRIHDAFAKTPTRELRSYFAQFYVGSGEVDKALALYDAIQTEQPMESALGKFRMLSAAGRYEKALEQARALATLDAGSVLSSVCIADSLEHLGKPEEALAELKRAYGKTNDAPLLIAMAQTCARAGQFDKAEAFYRTALAQNPNNTQALAGRGNILLRDRKYDAAINLYEQVVEKNPNDVAVLNNLAMAYAESGRNMNRAVTLAMNALARRPENPDVVDTLAFCLLSARRTDEAVALLENAITRMPNNPSLRYRYGVALLQADQPHKGHAALQQALEMGTFPDAEKAREILRKATR